MAIMSVIAAATAGSAGSAVGESPSVVAADAATYPFLPRVIPTQEPPVVNEPGSPGWGGGAPDAPMWASVPTWLVIPAAGVDTTLIPLGLLGDGTLDVPDAGFPAGWYTGAPTPGEFGPAVIAGHIDWNGPGVFFKLSRLVPGDAVVISRTDGSVATFAVTEVAQFGKDDFPAWLVYGGIDHAGLRLITCGGVFNRKSGHYEDNIVAFARLVSSTPPTPLPEPVATLLPAPSPAPSPTPVETADAAARGALVPTAR